MQQSFSAHSHPIHESWQSNNNATLKFVITAQICVFTIELIYFIATFKASIFKISITTLPALATLYITTSCAIQAILMAF